MENRGFLFTAIIVSAFMGAFFYYNNGPVGILMGVIFAIAALGFARFDGIGKGEFNFSIFDVLGVVAGAYYGISRAMQETWYPELSFAPGLQRKFMDSALFSIFWYCGGSGFFMYSLISHSRILMPFVFRSRRKVREAGPVMGESANEGYFGFDPGRFFGSEPEPEWSKRPAPKERLMLSYPRPAAYSTSEGMRIHQISGVADHSGHTRVAAALSDCCLKAMGRENGWVFLNQAARDEMLPRHVRQAYIHALQIFSRGQNL